MTDRKQRLAALADRIEQLQGPDRDLNYELLMALGWGQDEGYALNPAGQRVITVPDYTASLDAAMTLVPAGWRTVMANEQHWSPVWVWRLGREQGPFGKPGKEGNAATPALALCAAALRAQSETVA